MRTETKQSNMYKINRLFLNRFENHHQELFSWNYPTFATELLAQHRQQVNEILKDTTPEQYSLDQFIRILK
jgi:hypothetical protein